MKAKITLAALAAGALLTGALVPAASAEVTREEYKAAVEPICQANTKAIKKTLKGVEAGVKRGKLGAQAPKLTKASNEMRKTWRTLKAQPQPPADAAKLGKWLSYVKQEADLFGQLAQKARKGQKGAFSSIRSRMDTIANKANVEVLAFNFRHCRVEPSKLT